MKHVKKYNTGIVYECLLREISKSFIDNKKFNADIVFHILERYFLNKDAPLKKEATFFVLLQECEQLNLKEATDILKELERFAKNTDIKSLNESKNKLIEEVNAVLGTDILNHKLENYKILASVEQILEHYRNIKSFKDSVEKVKLENEIINYLTSPRTINENTFEPNNENVDKFVLGVAINELKKKYSNLDENQINIIKESITTKDIQKVQSLELNKIEFIKENMKYIGDPEVKSHVENIIKEYKPIEDFSTESITKTLGYFELAKVI